MNNKKVFKVIIAGGREFSDFDLLFSKCEKILEKKNFVEIVSGCARGADKLGILYAKKKGFEFSKFPANWDMFGKKAGFMRNQQMADYADALIAFWDGESRGTKDMIQRAKAKKIPVRIVKYKK